MANGFTAGGAQAGYPSNGFPGVNFYGAGTPGRVGVQSQASGGGGVRAALPAVAKNHMILALLLVVGGAYALWHWTATIR